MVTSQQLLENINFLKIHPKSKSGLIGLLCCALIDITTLPSIRKTLFRWLALCERVVMMDLGQHKKSGRQQTTNVSDAFRGGQFGGEQEEDEAEEEEDDEEIKYSRLRGPSEH
jgi:hypothetical protein